MMTMAQAAMMATKTRGLALRMRMFSSSGRDDVQLIEIDLGSVDGGGGDEPFGMKKLEEAIHAIVVRRSAPDWLPFLPGSSYWVPPRRQPGPHHNRSRRLNTASSCLADLLGSLKGHNPNQHASTPGPSERGWPSAKLFSQENPSRFNEIMTFPEDTDEEED